MVLSAFSWRIPPNAAAPKMILLLWWPVLPKGWVGIIGCSD